MKNRYIKHQLQQRLAEKQPLIQVLLGPRQVGKTTVVKAVISNRGIYHSADSAIPLDHRSIKAWWDEALASKMKMLAIDEIQKIPNWSEQIKSLWDQDPKIKLILTGSSALLIDKGLTETLAGRFEVIRAEHWNYNEAKESFNISLQQFIEFGCYPGSMQFLSDVNRWSQYIKDSIVEPAIGRDILLLSPVEFPALLRQLFGLAAAMPAQIISLQKIVGLLQSRVSVPTISNYLNLLNQAFLVTGLQKYSESQIRSRASIPKLIVHDNALIRSLERSVKQKLSPERLGHYFENAVGARFIEAGWNIFYWRERDLEVDFVVIDQIGNKLAIEVKYGNYSESDLKGLKIFCKRNPEFEPIIISSQDKNISGFRVLPPEIILRLDRNNPNIL